MSHVIILEGPDGSGKTTLAKELCRYGYEYAHEGPTPTGEEPLRYYVRRLAWALDRSHPVVFDRFHLGAFVYGPILRDMLELDIVDLDVLDRLILSQNVRIVMALPGHRHACQTWRKRANELIRDEVKYNLTYKAFVNLRHRYTFKKPRVVSWNYHSVNSRRMAENISNGIYLKELPRGAVGSLRARYLFIGDQSSDYIQIAPFVSNRGSSGYLNKALRLAGFHEHELAFVNAFKEDLKADYDLILKTIELLNPQRVIALGQRAAHLAHGLCIPRVNFVYHPQFWKRFRYDKIFEYANQLREVKK